MAKVKWKVTAMLPGQDALGAVRLSIGNQAFYMGFKDHEGPSRVFMAKMLRKAIRTLLASRK